VSKDGVVGAVISRCVPWIKGRGGKGVKKDEPRFEVFNSGYQDGE
jgi:hypothetical protein